MGCRRNVVALDAGSVSWGGKGRDKNCKSYKMSSHRTRVSYRGIEYIRKQWKRKKRWWEEKKKRCVVYDVFRSVKTVNGVGRRMVKKTLKIPVVLQSRWAPRLLKILIIMYYNIYDTQPSQIPSVIRVIIT